MAPNACSPPSRFQSIQCFSMTKLFSENISSFLFNFHNRYSEEFFPHSFPYFIHSFLSLFIHLFIPLFILCRRARLLRVIGLICNNASELDETTNISEVRFVTNLTTFLVMQEKCLYLRNVLLPFCEKKVFHISLHI